MEGTFERAPSDRESSVTFFWRGARARDRREDQEVRKRERFFGEKKPSKLLETHYVPGGARIFKMEGIQEAYQEVGLLWGVL
jgi:hypothetical protein